MERALTTWSGKRKGIGMLLAVAWLLGPVFGMAGAPGSMEADYVIDSWQTDSGLPHNFVNAIEQSRQGYLWVGTSNGVARFDGIRFKVYRTTDYPGLRDNCVLSVYEDRSGILWFGTHQGGLSKYQADEIVSMFSEGLSSEPILCLGESLSDELWVGTASGLSHSQDRVFFQSEMVFGGAVHSMRQPQRSGMIFATGKGIQQLRFGRVSPYNPGSQQLRTNDFYCLHQDASKRLWAGGPGGLVRVESTGEESLLPSSEFGQAAIVALLEAADGRIWFVTSDGGFYQMTSVEGPLRARLVARFPSLATALLQDNEGNFWVGTAGTGLYRVKKRHLRWTPFPQQLGENRKPCLFVRWDGAVMLLSDDNNLYREADGQFHRESRLALPAGVVVQTLFCPTTNLLWVGTRNDGLFRVDESGMRQFSERDGLSDSGITALAGSTRGLWIGTANGGLNLLHADGKVTRFNTPWGFMGAHASVLQEDTAGLWIGTSGDGLFRLEENRFVACTPSNAVSTSTIETLLADSDGTLWIGSHGGLSRWKAGRFTQFPAPNRLEPQAIVQIYSDAEGNLWVGSSSGLFRYRKEQLHAYAEDENRFLDVVSYGSQDGLPSVQCVPGVVHLGGRRSNFPFLFAASRGIVLGRDSVMKLNTDPPPVIIEAVLLESEPASPAARVRVPAGTSSLQFQFTALSLVAPEKVAFRYKLEGLDSEWSEATTTRSARYPRLAPGKYSFTVVARNNDGIWNETGASVALVVAPFWWETYWFRVGLGVLVAASAVGLYRMRRERRKEIERLRLKIAGDLHDDIGSSLWSINLLSRMLAQHDSLDAEQKHDVIEINRISVQTANSIRDIIWLINPAFDSMQELVLRMKDSAATTLRGIQFEVACENVDMSRRLPQEMRQNALLLFKECFTNIARHSHATEARMKVREEQENWEFELNDNGVGFETGQVHSGSGLKNMKRRVQNMGGILEIESSSGKGTRIFLRVRKPRQRRLKRWIGLRHRRQSQSQKQTRSGARKPGSREVAGRTIDSQFNAGV